MTEPTHRNVRDEWGTRDLFKLVAKKASAAAEAFSFEAQWTRREIRVWPRRGKPRLYDDFREVDFLRADT